MSDLPRVRVVAGILCGSQGNVLIADRVRSRSLQDHWEFPGGKLIDGETAEAALSRELQEELGIVVRAAQHFQHLEHDYPDLNVAIDFFLVSDWQGEPSGVEGQQVKWVTINTLNEQKLLPADAPVIEALRGL